MIVDIGLFILTSLHILAALSFILAVYCAIRLYQETDKGWYWLSLVLSAIFFALPQWIGFVAPLFLAPVRLFPPIIDEASEILGGLFLALSCYGMYKTMMHIRKRVDVEGVKKEKPSRGARKK